MTSSTLRTHKSTGNFTMVQNSIINDPQLSWGAKGLFTYLLSKPDGWKFYLADIVKRSSNGLAAVKGHIAELRRAGYVTLSRVVDEKGRVCEWRYDIYETPLETPVEGHLTVVLEGNEEKVCYPAAAAVAAEVAAQEDTPAPASHQHAIGERADGADITPPDTHKYVLRKWDVQKPGTSQDARNVVPAIETEYEALVQLMKENIEYDFFCSRANYRRWLEEWVFLVVDYLVAPGSTVTINEVAYPKGVVRSRMLKLNIEHFDRVKQRISEVDYPIRNMKKYIFSALYNSLATLDDDMGNEMSYG